MDDQQVAEVSGVLHIVSDLDKCCNFYSDIFGFKKESYSEFEGNEYDELFDLNGVRMRVAHLSLGNESFWLGQFISHKSELYPVESQCNDLWFQHMAIVVGNMESAFEVLNTNHVSGISPSPQTIPKWNKPAGGIKAYYFRGPENHPVELIYFPEDKGTKIWHDRSNNHLFEGIDHTAITIRDTDLSRSFYGDLLGMKVVGESLNYGETQERLSGVLGAKVRITAMRFDASRGMGIEFLEYQNPKAGRSKIPLLPHDLIATTTIIRVRNVEEKYLLAQKNKIPILSRSIVTTDLIKKGEKSFILADPDGHRILITSVN